MKECDSVLIAEIQEIQTSKIRALKTILIPLSHLLGAGSSSCVIDDMEFFF